MPAPRLFRIVIPIASAIFTCGSFMPAGRAESFIVQDGQPRAEIVIAENAVRTVRLAAQELQDYIEKISGAHLPIVTAPSEHATKLLVGRSAHTDQLGISADALKDGAYRIFSNGNAIVLIGQDTEFTPIEPWPKNNSEIVNGKAQREWDQITGADWGLPNLLIYKDRVPLPGNVGLPDHLRRTGEKLAPLPLWTFDERGSFNAVCGWLGKLGVRWYAPGELGEVVPVIKTLAVAKIDETVRPDFPIRRFNVRFGVHGMNLAMWAMRLGLRDPYAVQAAHGLDRMTNDPKVFAQHPDWFAMSGGQRRFQQGQNNQLCYSNDGLFQETVRNVRAQMDHFKMEVVSVMPPDGYTAICQCPLCAGKDSPEREQRGLASDYVWDFVNRVAKEVRRTHPDKKILNCAYGIYTLPPLKIAKLEPNVVVSIVGGRRPMSNKPEQQEDCRQLREGWTAKTSNPLIIFENYPFTDRGWYLPSFTPHSLGASINAVKGVSQGEDIWLSMRQDFEKVGMGFNHFPVYFTQRMYWGGPRQDVDAMFREYCRLFYGPAEQEMLGFFTHCEQEWQAMEKDKVKADAALALFAQAQAKVEPASIYGKRLALLDDFLKGLRNKSQQLGQVRGPVPVLRLVGEGPGKIVVDGQLDDNAWVNCAVASTGRLRELQTGRPPTFGTSVKTSWIGHDLYVAIRCDEHPGEKLNIGTTKKDDSALWYGDVVEVLLETESHSYYQIAISPSGAVADLDRSADRKSWFSWDAQAEVATHVADDHWNVEMRIPVTEDENDPLHQVIGHRPTRSLPWHINICRQRVREGGQEHSAFSPTGAEDFHRATKFATFYDGNSFQFDHGPAEDDFLEATRIAADFARTGRREEALAAYTAAAEGKGTDLQKAHALDLAATLARGLGKAELADQLASRIPIDAARKAVQMQILLSWMQSATVVAQFDRENIGAWPFWKRGDGYASRGRAYRQIKAGPEAEADLTNALEWTSEPRQRDGILLDRARNRAENLHDDDAALAGYAAILDSAKQLNTSDQFYALYEVAQIQTRRRQYDEALVTLGRVEPAKLQGFWRAQFQLWQGDTLLAADRKDAALAAYRSVVTDPTAEPRMRAAAEAKVAAMK